jgi:uncharacterized membrane protein YvbJ
LGDRPKCLGLETARLDLPLSADRRLRFADHAKRNNKFNFFKKKIITIIIIVVIFIIIDIFLKKHYYYKNLG